MTLGVLACIYGNAEMVPRVLEPWLSLKKEGVPLAISVINAQFKEYAKLGFPNDDDATRAALADRRDSLDSLIISSEPLMEHEARSEALVPLLERGVDAVWMLDGDEEYTQDQIRAVISYVEATPRFDYYHIHFDNRLFDSLRSKDVFCPPRIIRTNRHGGIEGFVWDNEVAFKDGSKLADHVPGIVPARIAHVLHHTWSGDRESLARKIKYQQAHFGYSSMCIGEDGTPGFDPLYFKMHGMPMPQVADDGTIVTTERPTLDVILRTHSTGSLRSGMKRLCDDEGGKEELSKRALRLLADALLVLDRRNEATVRLTIVDDGSSEAFCKHAAAIAAECPFPVALTSTVEPGNGASLRAGFEYARGNGGDIVYFVEDDYLHEPSALEEMFDATRLFTRNLGGRDVGLHPVDYIDRYAPQELREGTRVVLGTRRHWRTITKTTGTFLIPKVVLLRHWHSFMRLCEAGHNESASINPVWERHVVMFSPIPSLAVHLHGKDLLPPFFDWRTLWERGESGE